MLYVLKFIAFREHLISLHLFSKLMYFKWEVVGQKDLKIEKFKMMYQIYFSFCCLFDVFVVYDFLTLTEITARVFY